MGDFLISNFFSNFLLVMWESQILRLDKKNMQYSTEILEKGSLSYRVLAIYNIKARGSIYDLVVQFRLDKIV